MSELHVSIVNLSKLALQGVVKIDHPDKILRSKKKVALTGPVSQLKAIKDVLLCYIFKLCEQGITVNTFMVVLRASFILPEFRAKRFTVRCSCVKHFLIAHSFSYQMSTHTLQCPPAEVESKAFDFMQFMRLIVSDGNCDQRSIINMDQTPVYFTMNAKRRLEVIRKKKQSRFAC